MFQVFSNESLDEIVGKKPIILYYASPGACGIPGLLIAVFEDGSAYGYNSLLPNSETILVSIVNAVPELRPLLQFPPKDRCAPKRESIASKLERVNLGLGNYALVSEHIAKEMERYCTDKHELAIRVFKMEVEKKTGMKMGEMVVREAKADIKGDKNER